MSAAGCPSDGGIARVPEPDVSADDGADFPAALDRGAWSSPEPPQAPGNGSCSADMPGRPADGGPARGPGGPPSLADERVPVAGIYLEEMDGARQRPGPSAAPTDGERKTRRRSRRRSDQRAEGPPVFQPPDGGFGWVVMLASMWCNGAIFGIQNSFGILFNALLLEYRDDGGGGGNIVFKASWVGSLAMGMIFLCAPVVSVFTSHFGCRVTAVAGATVAFTGLLCSSFVKQLDLLYLTYGIVFAVGAAFAFQPSLVILGHYFKRRLGLVNGIVTAGSSAFTVALSFLMKHTLLSLGLVLTLQALSALMLPLIVAGFFYRPLMPKLVVDGGQTNAVPSACGRCPPLRNKTFCVWVCGVPIALFGYFVPYVHLMSYVKENLGEQAARHDYVLIMCIAVSSGLGRLSFGWLADLIPGVKKVYLQIAAFLVVGLMSVLIPTCSSLAPLAAVCVVMGLFDGCITALMAPIAFELVGPQHASQAIGIVLGLMSVPMTVGSPVAGLLRDWTGSYDVPFYLAGVPPLLGSVVLCFVPHVAARASTEGRGPEGGGAAAAALGTPLTPGDTVGSRGQLLPCSPAAEHGARPAPGP